MTRPTAPALLVLGALLAGCGPAPGAATATIAPTAAPAAIQPASPTAPPADGSTGSGSSRLPSPSPTPVVLDATGTTTVDLSPGSVPFAGTDGGQAGCRSGPDSRAVAAVSALDLGELGSGTLRGTLGLPLAAAEHASAELFIDAGDLADGSYQPFWTGPVRVTESHGEGATGTLTFHDLALEPDPGQAKAGETGPPADAGGWPATLSGTISWRCQPWVTPISGASAPPPSVGP